MARKSNNWKYCKAKDTEDMYYFCALRKHLGTSLTRTTSVITATVTVTVTVIY
jgi:hypothetical protein